MNCKQGDLAIVVRSACGNDGVIVRCVRLVGSHYPDINRPYADGGGSKPRWHEDKWVDEKAVEFADLIADAEARAKERKVE